MASYKALVGALAILLLTSLLAPGAVQADDPTPTPSPWPSPTLAYGGLRPTPSPYAVTPGGATFNIDADSKSGEIADMVINGYKLLNFGATADHGGAVDLILFVAMLLLTIQVLITLISEDGE